jgi:hypothetical protein
LECADYNIEKLSIKEIDRATFFDTILFGSLGIGVVPARYGGKIMG